ncbi:MAG: hypothetical protein Q9187_008309, partial [Circinaria calcarea]
PPELPSPGCLVDGLFATVAALSAFAAEFAESGYKLATVGDDPDRFLPDMAPVAAIKALLVPSAVYP